MVEDDKETVELIECFYRKLYNMPLWEICLSLFYAKFIT